MSVCVSLIVSWSCSRFEEGKGRDGGKPGSFLLESTVLIKNSIPQISCFVDRFSSYVFNGRRERG